MPKKIGTYMDGIRDVWSEYRRELLGFPSPQAEAAIETIAVFVGVETVSVKRWVHTNIFPNSLILIKFRYLLHILGYASTGFRALPEVLQHLSVLIAHDAVFLQEIKDFLGYSRMDDFLRPLNHKRNMSNERLKQLEEYLKQKHGNLPNEFYEQDLKQYGFLKPRSRSISPRQKSGDQAEAEESLATDIIAGIRGAIAVLHPLLQSLVEGSKESRKEFRAQFSTGELFEFSNSLHHFSEQVSGLCSEKALEVVASNGATEVAHG